MRRGAVWLALAAGLRLSGVRARGGRREGAHTRAATAQALSPPSLADRRQRLCPHQAALDHMVSDDPPAQPTEKAASPRSRASAILGCPRSSARNLKHKLLQAMRERGANRPRGGVIEIDDVYWAGEWCGGPPERGSPTRSRSTRPLAETHDGRRRKLRMSVLQGLPQGRVGGLGGQVHRPEHLVISDGLGRFRGIATAGVEHQPVVTGGGPASVQQSELTWVNTLIRQRQDRPPRNLPPSQPPTPAALPLGVLLPLRPRHAGAAPGLCRRPYPAEALLVAQAGCGPMVIRKGHARSH